MTSCRLSRIRLAAALSAVALATATFATFGATGASADVTLQKAPPGAGAIVSLLPCQAKLDYPPNQVGGVYVTNGTGKAIPPGAKLTTVLKIGGNSYPATKTMLGTWAAGQKMLVRTFIWNANAGISCSAKLS